MDLSSFDRTCYEFSVTKGGSFEVARNHCKKHGGDLIHGLKGPVNSFILSELERRKPKLKTQLVWIGVQKEEGITSRTWKWVDGNEKLHFYLGRGKRRGGEYFIDDRLLILHQTY